MDGFAVKPLVPVTLVAVDTTDKVHLAERAIQKCLEQATFADVKLLTHDTSRRHAIQIPRLDGLEAYSNFMTRKLHTYIQTSHALVVQSDGYIVNPAAWSNSFLEYDYIGAPWGQWKRVGNGGFSLRSKKLLEATYRLSPGESTHPEDAWISIKQRGALESLFRIRFADVNVGNHFAFEGRAFDGQEWKGMPTAWAGSFGFHSWLTVLPEQMDKPLIFHHSGDAGDVVYAMAVMKLLGGGVLFLSGDNRFPYPRPTRWQRAGAPPGWVDNLAPLVDSQTYVWATKHTHGLPFSTDIDLNAFRVAYQNGGGFKNIIDLHAGAFGLDYPSEEPWLEVEPLVEERDIIVNRTHRYLHERFPWKQLVEKYARRMTFVGNTDEYVDFLKICPAYEQVPFRRTKNLLEVARLIAGAKVFIGNQSCPLAIALGLGKNVIAETWLANANCQLKRNNAIHWKGGHCDIPSTWL